MVTSISSVYEEGPFDVAMVKLMPHPMFHMKDRLDVQIVGVAGLDPVDGVSESGQSKPHVVQSEGSDGVFAQGYPVLVIGTGLGSEKLNPFTPACAPLKFGHQAFFRCSAAPGVHVVTGDYGHMDFLDDSSPGS
ncbi:hypothetical protein GOP47_0006217 [Adiantum capillus-veneris]|uniref:Uncharacterized protein n=1 Tax=Adiantum capillus-veneris TaxID=13818 RepID=A0A9D4V355_ADICA|nr:hypothetical protein GOP47_0006217 [Adiantum capillus-veneris]